MTESSSSRPSATSTEISPPPKPLCPAPLNHYSEGRPLLRDPANATAHIHDEIIPEHSSLKEAYPTSAIPLIGSYSDLAPDSKDRAALKLDLISRYNGQGWRYPKLVNATWPEFFNHVVREVGPPAKPVRRTIHTVRGEIASSWEAWMLRAQREAARLTTRASDFATNAASPLFGPSMSCTS